MTKTREDNTVSSGIIGLTIVGVVCAFLWVIRPIVFPRHGTWLQDSYWVNGKMCGDVEDYTEWHEGWRAFSEPDFWIGWPLYDHYVTREAAVKAVEKTCR